MYETPKKRFTFISISVITYIAITFFISLILSSALTRNYYFLFHYDYLLLASYISMLLSMAITFLIVRFGYQKKINPDIHWRIQQKISIKEIIFCFVLGFGMNVAFSLLFNFLSEIFSIHMSNNNLLIANHPLINAVMIFTVVIAAPVFEEYLFRGVILSALRPYGKWFAVIISSVLFALLHGAISQAICVFLLGAIMAYVVIKSGSLWLSICIHVINNAIALLPSFIHSEPFSTIYSLILLLIMIIGVIFFIYFITKYKSIKQSMISAYDYPIASFFKNWASILLMVLLLLILIVSLSQAL